MTLSSASTGYQRVASFTIPFNLSWHPAATVRVGLSRTGLPIGMQIVAAQHDEIGPVLGRLEVAEVRRLDTRFGPRGQRDVERLLRGVPARASAGCGTGAAAPRATGRAHDCAAFEGR